MAVIRRQTVASADVEKKIITGMIVNDQFLTDMQRMAKKHYFTIPYAQTVFSWIQDYYKKYKKSPGAIIQDIYKSEREKLRESEADLMAQFIDGLSAYSNDANYDYLADQARDYFRERAIDLLVDSVRGNTLRGKIDQAENDIKNFSKVVKDLGTWFNPTSTQNIQNTVCERDSDVLLTLPGALGKMCGPIEREWLVALMGPMKRGKSWYLQEIAIEAVTQRLKTVIFSLEMNQRAMSKRLYKRMSGMTEGPTTTVLYPVFDCEWNQDNSCKKQQRVCSIGIKNPGDPTPTFGVHKGYKVCTSCKDPNHPTHHAYSRAIWKEVHDQVDEFDAKNVALKVKKFTRIYGDNLRIKAYPAFTATFDDIISDLDDLEYTEGFVPDVICIDYLDIMAPESGNLSERGAIDRAWKRAKGLAAQRHCLVATVLQSNRDSISKDSIQQESTSEDIRKLAHVDIMFGLNQTPSEKDDGVMRISIIAHRHSEFNTLYEAMVLQSLSIGQPMLDDMKIPKPKKKKKGEQ
jgi:replicative DNA helicase